MFAAIAPAWLLARPWDREKALLPPADGGLCFARFVGAAVLRLACCSEQWLYGFHIFKRFVNQWDDHAESHDELDE